MLFPLRLAVLAFHCITYSWCTFIAKISMYDSTQVRKNILRLQKEVQWMVRIIELEASPFLPAVIFSSSPLQHLLTGLKHLSWRWVITRNITVSRMTRRLEGKHNSSSGMWKVLSHGTSLHGSSVNLFY